MVSDGVGVVSGGVGVVQCRMESGGCGGCRSVRTCTRLQVLSVLSGCRVVGFRVVSGGVGLSGLLSGRAALLCGISLAPRFDPDNNKQGVEESNPTCIP